MPATETKPDEVLSDDYLALIRRRPLRPIRDDDDYDAAVEIMYGIDARREKGEPVSQDEMDYSDTTMLLLAHWDEQHNDWRGIGLSLVERLEGLMENAHLDPPKLAAIAGISGGEMGEVLADRGVLPPEAVTRLAAHFRLGAGYFF